MGKAPSTYWDDFQPPPLPEAEKLKAVVEMARRLTPGEVLQISVSAGIHNPDGSLTERYRE